MKFDWTEYLRVAQELSNDVQEALKLEASSSKPKDKLAACEAKLRSSISRSYYSAFCIARNYLRDVDENITLQNWKAYDINVHKYVIEEFQRSRDAEWRKVGNYLYGLRNDRNKADYDDFVALQILESKAKASLISARYVVDLINKLSQT